MGGYPQYWYPYLQPEQYAYSPKGMEPAPSSPMAYPQPVMYGGYYASMGSYAPQSPQWAPYSPDQFAQYAYPGPPMPLQTQPGEEQPQPPSEATVTPSSEGSQEPHQESSRGEGRDRPRRGSLAKGQHKAGSGILFLFGSVFDFYAFFFVRFQGLSSFLVLRSQSVDLQDRNMC